MADKAVPQPNNPVLDRINCTWITSREELNMTRATSVWIAIGAAVTCSLLWTARPVTGQSATKNIEWRWYGSDLANTHYSPADQIDGSNFSKLVLAWRFRTESLGPRPEYNMEGTPLMANGVVYSTAGTRRSVVALDAVTGELL